MQNKIKYLPIGILTLTTALTGVGLASARVAAVESSASKTAQVLVTPGCNFASSASNTVAIDVFAGTTVNTEADNTRGSIQLTCANSDGFKVQAVGYSPNASSSGANVEGETGLYNAAENATIATNTTGDASYWSFKITSAYAMTSAAIANGYNTYAKVPSTSTDVVTFAGSASNTVFGVFRTDYQVHASTMQAPGTYQGAVKYTIVPVTNS